jgi:hypothetical protein
MYINDKKNAILFVTHKYNEEIEKEIKKIRDDMKVKADMFVVYQSEQLVIPQIDGVQMFPFTIDDLNSLEYCAWGCTIMDGNFHFVILNFFRQFAGYDNYWLIEYDVRFNGNWNTFFSFFEDKNDDFIAAHVETVDDNPNWERWDEIEVVGRTLSKEEKLKSFNPIYRISNKGLNVLAERCQIGDRGHNEILIPTTMHLNGLKIADFGGLGQYIYKEHPNLFYVDDGTDENDDKCTFRFRPNYSVEEMKFKDMLYHPIK